MRKLTLSLLIVVLIATVGLGWLFDRLYEQYTENEQTQDVNAVKILEQFGSELAITLNNLADRQAFIEQWPTDSKYSLSIISVDDFPMPVALLDKLKLGEPLLLESSDNLSIHYYLPSSNELLVIKSSLINITKTEKPLDYLFTTLFYLALLMLFLLWVYPLIRRLIILRKAAKAFGEGELEQRVALSSISYIGDIELEFNNMAQRIENLVGDVKLLSTAVSHDLRTPLARIRFGIDTLQEEDDPALRRRFEEKISNNVDEMTSLVETLLRYARLDQTMLEINKEKINFPELVDKCIKNKLTDSVNIKFLKHNSAMEIYGDASYLSMLVNNLLQNAIQYSEQQVSVNLIEQHNGIQLIIADDGKGISEENRANVLKPFVRIKASQQKDSQKIIKGHGMGLAIVKRILDWHQGTIQVDNSPELSGAEFTITLPKGKHS